MTILHQHCRSPVDSAAVQLRAALEVYPGEEQAYLAYGQVLQALGRVAMAKDDQSGALGGRWPSLTFLIKPMRTC